MLNTVVTFFMEIFDIIWFMIFMIIWFYSGHLNFYIKFA